MTRLHKKIEYIYRKIGAIDNHNLDDQNGRNCIANNSEGGGSPNGIVAISVVLAPGAGSGAVYLMFDK
jgi:hypothetical protein